MDPQIPILIIKALHFSFGTHSRTCQASFCCIAGWRFPPTVSTFNKKSLGIRNETLDLAFLIQSPKPNL